jgi:hypothetical protein
MTSWDVDWCLVFALSLFEAIRMPFAVGNLHLDCLAILCFATLSLRGEASHVLIHSIAHFLLLSESRVYVCKNGTLDIPSGTQIPNHEKE